MAENEGLKACPFCGDAARFIDDTSYGDCLVFCANEFNGCPAPCSQSSASEPDKAIAAWNRRASETDLVAALRPVSGWLKYAYGHVSSVTSEKVKAHLPVIEALLSKYPEV